MSPIDRIRPHPSKALQRGILTGDTTGHAQSHIKTRLGAQRPTEGKNFQSVTFALALIGLGRVVNYCNSTRSASPDFENV